MAKPSARLAPAPPCFSGTQASVRPASDNARYNFSFQLLSRARLIVCGSARSANIRAAVSATILSLSVTIAAPAFYSMAGTIIGPWCGPVGPFAGGCLGLTFVELIGATIPGSVAVIKNKKQPAGQPSLESAAHPGRIQWVQNLPHWRQLFSPA